VNFTDEDLGLIYDSITWELALLPLHQKSEPSPRMIRLLQIQNQISEHLSNDLP
jgi:hypothetical protein